MNQEKLKKMLGEYYDELFDFFEEIYEKYKNVEYCKIVILTKTCKKLLDFWVAYQNRIDSLELKSFLDRCTFSLEDFTEERKRIIKTFKDNRNLPRVVYVDWISHRDLKINRALFQYKNEFIENCEELSPESKEILINRITNTASIHIFAKDDNCISFMTSRYRSHYTHNGSAKGNAKLQLNALQIHTLQIRVMSVLQSELKDANTGIDQELIHIIDETLVYIRRKKAKEEKLLIDSGIFLNDKELERLSFNTDCTLDDFINLCSMFNKKHISLNPKEIAKVLVTREQQGYISLIRTPQERVEIDIYMEVLQMWFIKYISYIPFLIELTRRCRESQLDLQVELYRAIDYISLEDKTCSKEELYQFLLDLENEGYPPYSLDIELNTLSNMPSITKEQVSEISSKQCRFLQKYKSI